MAEQPSDPRADCVSNGSDRPPRRIADRGANREVARRLHQAVRAAGGNQAVARRSGVPLATVNNYVRGRSGMKIEPLWALATACNVSLEWLVSGGTADTVGLPDGSGSPAGPDFPTALDVRAPGLGEAPSGASPAGIDVRILAKAIEIVAAIAGPADLHDDPKSLAQRIATTYAVLIEPDASRK
jgi:transcriptional regulator with XRE-family HTH domain